ncbi:MAG: hypothetical protein WDZ90_02550 [Candidatus Paceibacterota bacterium]
MDEKKNTRTPKNTNSQEGGVPLSELIARKRELESRIKNQKNKLAKTKRQQEEPQVNTEQNTEQNIQQKHTEEAPLQTAPSSPPQVQGETPNAPKKEPGENLVSMPSLSSLRNRKEGQGAQDALMEQVVKESRVKEAQARFEKRRAQEETAQKEKEEALRQAQDKQAEETQSKTPPLKTEANTKETARENRQETTLEEPLEKIEYVPRTIRKAPREILGEPVTQGSPQIETGGAQNETGTKKSILTPLRTFKSDLAGAMKKQKTSVVSAAAAESNRRARNAPPKIQKESEGLDYKKYFIITISILLFVAGGTALFFVFTSVENKEVKEMEETPSLIFVESKTIVDVTGDDRRELLQALTSAKEGEDDPLGSIRQIVPTITNPTTNRISTLTAEGFVSQIEARVPSSFTRSLLPVFTFGIHSFDGNEPVLVFKTDSYETAFAGMLEWEEEINDNLSPLFGPLLEDIPLATTTATETATRFFFKDEVVRNHDARVLRNQENEIVLLYGFPSQGTLIITTNPSTFAEAIVRLAR